MKTVICAAVLLITASQAPDMRRIIKADVTLVAPGIGAERLLLGEPAREALSLCGYPARIAEFEKAEELFREIYHVDAPIQIPYDRIYYYKKGKLVVLIRGNAITAIIGLGSGRITVDAVDLNEGADVFIAHYGSTGAKTIQKNENRIIIYPELGIAIVDDRSDNTIDLYIIFQIQSPK